MGGGGDGTRRGTTLTVGLDVFACACMRVCVSVQTLIRVVRIMDIFVG